MTTDDLGLAGWRKSQFTEGPNPSGYYTAGIDIPRLDTFGKPDWHYCAIEFHSKEKSEAEARRDIVISALRSPRAVPANGAGREALEQELADCRQAVATIEAYRTGNATQSRNYAFYQGKVAALEYALASSPVVGRAEVIEEVATALANWYPDNVSTNAFCAAIRSLSHNSPEQDRASDCKANPELTGHSEKERSERVPFNPLTPPSETKDAAASTLPRPHRATPGEGA